MTPARPIPTERREMQILATYLDLKGLFWIHPPNEGQRSAAQGALLKRQGLKPGAPDVIILQRSPVGHHGVMIELKRRAGGRLSAAQDRFLTEAEKHGWRVYIAKGAADAIEFLQQMGW